MYTHLLDVESGCNINEDVSRRKYNGGNKCVCKCSGGKKKGINACVSTSAVVGINACVSTSAVAGINVCMSAVVGINACVSALVGINWE